MLKYTTLWQSQEKTSAIWEKPAIKMVIVGMMYFLALPQSILRLAEGVSQEYQKKIKNKKACSPQRLMFHWEKNHTPNKARNIIPSGKRLQSELERFTIL